MQHFRTFSAIATSVLSALIFISSSAIAQTTSLPSGWTNGDVGNPVLTGSATVSGDVVTLRGAGSGIGSTADEFQFMYRTFNGDIDMSVRVADLQTTTGQAGLMIRESLNPDAPTAFVALRGQNATFQSRMRAGHKMSIAPGPAVSEAIWVRLVRQGRSIRSYTSSDGATWVALNSANVTMNSSALIGVAVSSHEASVFASATFTTPAFGTPAAPQPPALPTPWTTRDIGGPATAGAASATDGVFTVKGSGLDIWDAADQFRFVYQAVTGDTQIIARVASFQATNGWSKAGVMIRSTLSAGAAHVSLFATGANGWSFQRRMYESGASDSTLKAGSAPGWVRLVREGQLITGYHSADGSNWTLLGTETIQLPSTVYIGLAVTSQDVTTLSTATFGNAVVSAPTNTNTPPSISITSPAANATFSAPANIAVSAAASDSDGLVQEVRFFANNTLIGTDTAAPFTVSWPNVAAGTYSLTAVATDNGGGSTTSIAVAITVGTAPAPTIASRVAFTPPVDYATNVTSVSVQLRRSTDPVSAIAIATRSLGKPASSGENISIDISTLVDPLPAGSYYAIVVATGPGGATASSPSPAFTK